jgi:proteasome lid subunit RPN8/RPN11
VTSKSSRLELARGAREAVLSHARAGAATDPPREVCGVLVGRRGGVDRVTDVRRVENVASNPRVAYELDPAAAVETVEAVEAAGDDVVGFYHSHPESAPVPSETDRREATWTGYVYLVCHPDGRLNAFRWTGEAFDELSVTLV